MEQTKSEESSVETATEAPSRRRTNRRRTVQPAATQRKRRRRIVIGTASAAAVVVAWGGYVAYEATQIKLNLEEAAEFATQTKDALLAGNSEEAVRSADDAARYAGRAKDATDSVSWRIAAAIPGIGGPFDTTRQISDVVQGLASDVLRPAVEAGSALSPDQLLLDGARIDLTGLRDAAPVLAETAAAADELAVRASEIDSTFVSQIDGPRQELVGQTTDLSSLLGNVSTAAEIAPAMLGADGPRSYFIGFQTNAEARGTGGLLGGFGELHAVDGAVRVDELASNRELSLAGRQGIDLGPDFERQYGQSRPTTDFRNSNASSHFPYAAQIWRSLWAQESGTQVDGVIATDPVALSYVLKVVGPVVMPDGEKVTADNVVELTESTAYTRFGTDNNARKQYLQNIAGKVVERMTGKISQPQALLEALGRAASEGRLAVWSSQPDEQDVLADTPLGHIVPDDDAPYAGVVVNNLGGNKLDYYLQREIDYTADSCSGDTRATTVKVRLTNTLPPGDYTKYVAGMFDNPMGAPAGTNLTNLSLVATQGAKLGKVTVDGKPAFAFTGAERGHPVFDLQFPIPQGKTVEVVYQLTEPASAKAPVVPVQPLVDAPTLKVDVPACKR
ncbi:DUF4012 domain-containing protein [Rhodococcus hoagii]|uniref:DUF4012 domain-containing protein n=1 Tax=Rhodococcus hoagii TaxID=43767 RepID=UPI000A10C873|nr:DUF4012 domain-containing protein [Prescottella equi]NKS58860.1 DUF4012 domain-containing protein [Prescottella equi]NKS69109.1 DUF4012 domain-containing protein [Prescottella equi]